MFENKFQNKVYYITDLIWFGKVVKFLTNFKELKDLVVKLKIYIEANKVIFVYITRIITC